MQMKEVLTQIMSDYLNKKKIQTFNKNSTMYQLINNESMKVIEASLLDKNIKLNVKASCGTGVWTRYPWIAIANPEITTTIQEGVYIVYLFSEDMNRVYLTLNQGCTNLKKNLGTKVARIEMKRIRETLREKYRNNIFNSDNNLIIGNEDYEEGCIFYKEYIKDNIPDNLDLKNDLYNMVEIYDNYFKDFILEKNEKLKTKSGNNEDYKMEGKMVGFNEVDIISNYISNKGFIYSKEDLSNFYLSLKSKPFVILAGVSGTGKSRLVRLFAEAIDAEFKSIPVKPDWNDSTELLGYKNIKNEFVKGELYEIIEEASNNKDKPYFVCLDEMNLARVEYYLSEYLSVIESRRFEFMEGTSPRIVTDDLFSKSYFDNVEAANISIPENLYIVGTVNMDDTTFSFSRKVLDRANTIEFSTVELALPSFGNFEDVDAISVSNSALKSSFISLRDAMNEDNMELVENINKEIIKIYDLLKPHSKQFGYRVRDEIIFYMLENKQAGLLSEDEAFDYQIMQKILPTIIGSDSCLKDILLGLLSFCFSNKEFTMENLETAQKAIISQRNDSNNKDIKYPRSAEKILLMLRGYKDGFVSFW